MILSKYLEIEVAWQSREGFSRHRRPMRERLSSEQNHRCAYCGVRCEDEGRPDDRPTIEHVVPRSRGGPDAYENLVMACRLCNDTRGTMRAHEAFALIAAILRRVG